MKILRVNPIRAIVEMIFPEDRKRYASPLKKLPENHPTKQYCYTLLGLNGQVLSVSSLLGLGFIGKVRNSADFIILEDQMLFKDINVVVQIAKLYNIIRIRKYHDTGHGIEWEGNTHEIYKSLLEKQLFSQFDESV